jgi:hypothetical protein
MYLLRHPRHTSNRQPQLGEEQAAFHLPERTAQEPGPVPRPDHLPCHRHLRHHGARLADSLRHGDGAHQVLVVTHPAGGGAEVDGRDQEAGREDVAEGADRQGSLVMSKTEFETRFRLGRGAGGIGPQIVDDDAIRACMPHGHSVPPTHFPHTSRRFASR